VKKKKKTDGILGRTKSVPVSSVGVRMHMNRETKFSLGARPTQNTLTCKGEN
jgi:hypothetical protein